MKHYAERDTEGQGEHYVNHVMAMTSENLHGKSNIAAELAHRDIRIAELEAMVTDAYADGWEDGYNTSSLGGWEVDWRDSETCKRLTGEE